VVSFPQAGAPVDASEAEGAESAEEPPKKKRTHKAGYGRKPAFGSPNSPQALREEDDRIKRPVFRVGEYDDKLHRWFDWKGRVNERHGLQLSGHYVTLYQLLSDSLTEEDNAWSGLLRLTAEWDLVGRGTENHGGFVLTLDQRHAFTDVAPSDLGFEAGYAGVTGTLMSGVETVIVNLNWAQALNESRAGLLIGRFDPSDYMNVLGYANPWTSFQNLAVLLEASVAFPDASWGAGAGSWIGDQWWVSGTVNDANGALTDDLELFEGGSELFSQLSWGWSPSKEDRFLKSVTMSAWHVDDRDEAGIEEAEGLTFSTNWTWSNTWMIFFRAGYSDGAAPIYNQSATVGFMRRFNYRSDLTGVGINWGDPPDDALGDQLTVEAFYRIQIAQNLAITPSVQYLKDPALNPVDDEIWVTGLRLRATY